MKRFFTTVVLIAVLCVMSGCKKDGVYRPSQKLSGISEYFERTHQRYDNELKVWKVIHKDSTKRHQTEKWIWNDNRLDRIDFYSGNNVSNSLAFTYDGKRLVRAYISETKSGVEYHYNGKKLETMTVKNKNGETVATYEFKYDGKKISQITIDGNAVQTKSDIDIDALALLPVLGDAQSVHDLAECHKKDQAKKGETVYRIVWKGDNIKSISNASDGNTVTYRYDDKYNPLQGLMPTLIGVGENVDSYAFANKNNVISVDYGNSKLSYSYTYSEKLPVSRSRNEIDHYTQGYRYVDVYITYFEYIE